MCNQVVHVAVPCLEGAKKFGRRAVESRCIEVVKRPMSLTKIRPLHEGVSGYRVLLDARLVSLILTSSWVNMVFCTMFAHFAPASFDTGATEACPKWVLVACWVRTA